jgi:hypothetical protein
VGGGRRSRHAVVGAHAGDVATAVLDVRRRGRGTPAGARSRERPVRRRPPRRHPHPPHHHRPHDRRRPPPRPPHHPHHPPRPPRPTHPPPRTTPHPGHTTIIASARIDNRDDLLPHLQPHLQSPHPTDTELILAAHHHWGDDAPHHLIGDYAYLIHDTHRRTLHAARDPMGMRPLYYHHTKKRTLLASEATQILSAPGVETRSVRADRGGVPAGTVRTRRRVVLRGHPAPPTGPCALGGREADCACGATGSPIPTLRSACARRGVRDRFRELFLGRFATACADPARSASCSAAASTPAPSPPQPVGSTSVATSPTPCAPTAGRSMGSRPVTSGRQPSHHGPVRAARRRRAGPRHLGPDGLPEARTGRRRPLHRRVPGHVGAEPRRRRQADGVTSMMSGDRGDPVGRRRGVRPRRGLARGALGAAGTRTACPCTVVESIAGYDRAPPLPSAAARGTRPSDDPSARSLPSRSPLPPSRVGRAYRPTRDHRRRLREAGQPRSRSRRPLRPRVPSSAASSIPCPRSACGRASA